MKQIISTENAPGAIGPYSQAVKAGPFIYCSGQIPLDPVTGELVTGSIENQTTVVLNNISALLKAAGASLNDVIKTTIFLTDLKDFQAVNDVYGRFFTGEFPARTTVQVSALPKGAAIEIEIIAFLK